MTLLARRILHTGRWPASWKLHWILPLYKRKFVFQAGNYRGVHLTSQLSKVVERLLAVHLTKHFETSEAYGKNQFVYRRGWGYKNALALNTLTWLWNLNAGQKTGVYYSDVEGVFDRVEDLRLLQKLLGWGFVATF